MLAMSPKRLAVVVLVALVAVGAAFGALLSTRGSGHWRGSTVRGTFVDRNGDGVLERGPGRPVSLGRRSVLLPARRRPATASRLAGGSRATFRLAGSPRSVVPGRRQP